ncbi:unnamed protein product [Trichobilharzia regenti]|nr:unnamed protein product [Trichobilharzia regenti]
MTEGSSNFGQSTPSANFSNYLANSNQFNNSYNQNCQNPNYPPLFHPAAVAAVAAAAAAAGYTQQFNPGVIIKGSELLSSSGLDCYVSKSVEELHYSPYVSLGHCYYHYDFNLDILMEVSLTERNDLGIDLLPGSSLMDLEYADDIVLLGEDADKMQSSEHLEQQSSYVWHAIGPCKVF